MNQELKRAADEFAVAAGVKTSRATVKDKLSVVMQMVRSEVTNRPDSWDPAAELEVSFVLKMRGGVGRALPLVAVEAALEVEYNFADGNYETVTSVKLLNAGKLGILTNYVEALIQDSWHEWIDSLEHPPESARPRPGP